MQFIRVVWQLIGRHQRAFITITLGAAAYEAIKIASPYLFGKTIDTLIATNGTSISRVFALIAAIAVVDLVVMVLDLILDRRVLAFLFEIEYDVSTRAAKKVLDLSLAYHERERAGNVVTRVDRGTEKFLELINDVCWQGMPTIIQVGVTIIAMACIDRDIALVFAAFVPPFLWLIIHQQYREDPFRRERYQAYEDASGRLGEMIWNVLTVQSFGREASVHGWYRTIRDRIIAVGRSQYLIGTRYNFGKSTIVNTGRVAVLCTAVWEATHGTATIGDVVLFLTLSEKAYTSLNSFSHIFGRIANAHEGVRRLAQLLGEQPTIIDVPAAPSPILTGAVTFERVTFSYEGATPVLRDVSFAIRPGETVAFAGPSGGGKSTIVKLLFRHYDATSGRILLDGHNIRELERTAFRQQFGYVPQEGQLFSGTVAENVRFGKLDATDAEVRNAAELAGAAEFIVALPRGYDTVIGEQGVKLSGGQRQRMCIARAVIRQPKILVFDEATSSLDVESERVIQDALRKLQGTTTIILIAHRLSTIQHADRIIVIEDGQIVEEGSHTELFHQNGLYQRLVALSLS
ncbi:MAG: ABC transporter ATP-binding protein [Candidatus Uhrbacteria bacterium]